MRFLPLFLLAFSIAFAQGQNTPLPTAQKSVDQLWQESQNAISQHLPELAIAPLQQLRELQQTAPQHTNQISEIETLSLLAEAYVRSGQANQALTDLPTLANLAQEALSNHPHLASYQFWLGQAHFNSNSLSTALELFSSPPAQTNPTLQNWFQLSRARTYLRLQQHTNALEELTALLETQLEEPTSTLAKLLAVEIYLQTDDLEQAAQLLDSQPDSSNIAEQILRARLARANFSPDSAEILLKELLVAEEPTSLQLSPLQEALVTLELAKTQRHTAPTEAISTLTAYLQLHPTNPLVEEQILELSLLNWHTQEPIAEKLLQWAESAPEPLNHGAVCLLALRAYSRNEFQTCKRLLNSLPPLDPNSFFYTQTTLLSAIITAEDGETEALQTLINNPYFSPVQQTILEARVQHANGFFGRATDMLTYALTQATTKEHSILHYNLAWIEASKALPLSEETQENLNEPSLQLHAIQQSLQQENYPQATELLHFFLSQSPSTEQSSQAVLAWTSSLLNTAPLPVAAEEILQQLQALERSSLATEQRKLIDEFTFLAALQLTDSEQAEEAFEAFSARYPNEEHLPLLRLRLAEKLFTLGNFAGALFHYDEFLRTSPEHPVAPLAKYAAALATFQLPTQEALQRSVQRFAEIVASENSTYRKEALLGQIQALMRLGEQESAATLIQETRAQEWTSSFDFSLQCLYGEALAPQNSAAASQALQLWEEMVLSEETPLFWRERAAYLLGQQLQTQDKIEQALALYFQVSQGLSDSTETDPAYYESCIRAAISLLESQQRGAAAAAFAESAATRLSEPKKSFWQQRAEEIRQQYALEPQNNQL